MKILYVSNILTVHDYRFLEKLSSNHEAHLVTFKEEGVPDNIRNIKNLNIFHKSVNYFVFKPKENILAKTIKSIINGINFIKKYVYIKYIIGKIKPDIIHAVWIQDAGYLAALSGFYPFFLMTFGSDVLIRPYMNNNQMKITQYVLSKADSIACDCEIVKDEIIKISDYYKNKVFTFIWGVDFDVFNQNNKNSNILESLDWQDKKIVIITRQLEVIYGLNYMISAIPEVIKKIPDARFIFCGDGEEKDNLKKLVNHLDVDDYVYFVGFIEHNELPNYLNNADIYVSTSLSDGTSVSLLEAFACGKPVVVTDVPANLEWVKDGENGYIVPRCDSKILAEKTITLLEDEDMRRKMGQKNIEIVKEKASWDKNFEIIEKIYENLIRSKKCG